MTEPEIQGYCDSKFSAVRDVLAQSLAAGQDTGASFAVTIGGETVVDIWGGHTDQEKTSEWQKDTIVNVYSTTKTMSFLCALKLADEGRLDFNANVADYWPEFAAEGKEQVKVWHIMDHAAGLSGFDRVINTAEMYDWQTMVDMLAAQKPWWEPGTATGYHALTQGFLIGEVVRRITGQSLGHYFRENIAEPLGADFMIGVPESEFARIGYLFPPGGDSKLEAPGDKDSIANRSLMSAPISALESRTAEWRKAEIPAGNGHGNARSVAQIHAILAGKGEVAGKRYLSEATACSVMEERISGTDLVLGIPVRFGLGFAINPEERLLAPNKNVCYWGGWGGSLALIDQDAAMSISFVMNQMHEGLVGDLRSYNLCQAVYAALSK